MMCKTIPEPNPGSTEKCTDGTHIGSQCLYSCVKGYKDAIGENWKEKGENKNILKCIVKKGEVNEAVWSGVPPLCDRK